MTTFLYIAAILGLAGIEGRPLFRGKKWVELAVFSVLILCGTAIIVMDSLTYEPFRFTKITDYFFRPYFKAVKSFLLRF